MALLNVIRRWHLRDSMPIAEPVEAPHINKARRHRVRRRGFKFKLTVESLIYSGPFIQPRPFFVQAVSALDEQTHLISLCLLGTTQSPWSRS